MKTRKRRTRQQSAVDAAAYREPNRPRLTTRRRVYIADWRRGIDRDSSRWHKRTRGLSNVNYTLTARSAPRPCHQLKFLLLLLFFFGKHIRDVSSLVYINREENWQRATLIIKLRSPFSRLIDRSWKVLENKNRKKKGNKLAVSRERGGQVEATLWTALIRSTLAFSFVEYNLI